MSGVEVLIKQMDVKRGTGAGDRIWKLPTVRLNEMPHRLVEKRALWNDI